MTNRGRAPDADAGAWRAGVRWAARVLAALMVLLVFAFLVGEGVAFARLTAVEWTGMGAIAMLCAGLLLGWKREAAGGLLALAGLAALLAIELIANGRPLRGWAWPLLGLPAALYLVSAWARGVGRAALSR